MKKSETLMDADATPPNKKPAPTGAALEKLALELAKEMVDNLNQHVASKAKLDKN